MATTWLPVTDQSSSTKGSSSTVSTTDSNSRTTNKGAKVTTDTKAARRTTQNKGEEVTTDAKAARLTTQNKGAEVTTNARGAKVTTRAETGFTKTGSTTVTEDAGGVVSFSIPIRGGLGVTGAAVVCPVTP